MDRSKYKKVYSVIEKRRQIRTEEFAKTRRKPIMVLVRLGRYKSCGCLPKSESFPMEESSKRMNFRKEEFAKTRRKPIMVLDTINKTVKKYISTVEASKHIGINKPMISYMLKSGSIVNGLEIKYQ